MIHIRAGSVGSMMVGAVSACAMAQPSSGFWLMGYPPGGTNNFVRALSQNGLVAGGSSYGMPGYLNAAFRWTATTGRVDWGLEGGMPANTIVGGLDNTGLLVVGFMAVTGGDKAYRRAGDGPLENLGVLPQTSRSYAKGISGDGTIVVGYCNDGGGAYYAKAFRWTAEKGMQDIGHLTPQTPDTRAQGISRDGTTIVGQNVNEVLWFQAFIWTEAGGMKVLPSLTGAPSSDANAVDADGSVVVGSSASVFGNSHAARWVDGQPHDLASALIPNNSLAFSVNDDGSVVGGSYQSGAASFAFIWSEATGMLDAKDYLALHGITVPAGYKLEYIYAISGDGRTFGGQARNLTTKAEEGFVATISGSSCQVDCDASGTLDIDDFICFQTRFAINDPYADCDASGALDIDDFICFQTLFAVGC